ncbi:MAG: PAS domain S-box protein, partial [Lentimicrobium sp.]|nr:PAS domain S-box protein [Lentimicrobium sp.]
MENQQKTKEELIAENKFLREKLGLLNINPDEEDAEQINAFTQSDQSCNCRPELTRYALDLAYLPGEEFYPFIVSKIADIFGAKMALISLYKEDQSELHVKYSSLSKREGAYLSQLIGKKITSLRIKISLEQYDFICSKPHHFATGLNELSFGAIPSSVGIIAESALDLGWFVGLGLTHQKKLLGTIVMIGSKNQTPPDNENLDYFSSITASAIGRKIAEDALIESEARFRKLFDEAPVGYLSLDADGHLIDVNQAWLNMTGYEQTEVIGKRIDYFLSQSSLSDFPKKFMTFKEQGKTHCDLELLHKDGHVINVEFDGKIGYDVNGDFNQTHCILKDITAQWQADQLAHEREEMFQAIANHTANWESWFDNNGKIIWTNPAAFRFTGYTPDEIIAMPDYVSAFVAEPDRARVTALLKEALQGKDSSNVEFSCIRKDQSRFRISISWNHIFNKNGKALGIRTSGQDITSHRQAEEAVSQSENLYRQMIDNAPFGMHFYELSDNGQLIFTSANPAANKILNLDHNQFVGLEISNAFPSLKETGVIGHYKEAAINNSTWVTDQINYQDNKISGAFEVKAFQTMPGKMVAIFTDITKRKQAEEELNESRQLFETLTRVSPVGIFRTNAQGGTTFVNPKWIALTGLGFEDALESKYLDAVHPDDREERKLEWLTAVSQGKPVVSEYRFQRADGNIVWVQGHAVPEIADNKIKGYIGTLTDISDLKKAEEEILKAKEKAEAGNRLKTTFMGNISHEIRTPLNGIIGFAELITSGNNTDEENNECVEFLNHSIQRLTKIIDNIMDVSVMMSGNTTIKKEPVDIDNIL